MRHPDLVEGLVLPARLSGHAALDFTNTLVGWNGADRYDYLASFEHLAVWAGFAELLARDRVASLRAKAAADPRAAARALERARDARTLVYEALCPERDAARIGALADAVQEIAGRVRLARAGDRTVWLVEPEVGLAAPVVAVLWRTAELLTSADAHRVRSCPGRACGWLFIDRSGRRRWCTMATCGNREKARRFAARHPAASSAADRDLGLAAGGLGDRDRGGEITRREIG